MLAWLTPQLHGSAWLGDLITRKMLQMPRLEQFVRHTKPVWALHGHIPACGQPRVYHWDSGILFKSSHYNLWPQWMPSLSHTGLTVSHQQTWSNLRGRVVTCSVILITICSFRCAEGSRGDVQGQAVPKGTGQYCVCFLPDRELRVCSYKMLCSTEQLCPPLSGVCGI